MYFIVLADAMFCICVCGRYARKYLSNVEPELIAEFQEAMALLAFSLDTKCMKYRVSGGKLIHWSESRGRKDVGLTVGLRLGDCGEEKWVGLFMECGRAGGCSKAL